MRLAILLLAAMTLAGCNVEKVKEITKEVYEKLKATGVSDQCRSYVVQSSCMIDTRCQWVSVTGAGKPLEVCIQK